LEHLSEIRSFAALQDDRRKYRMSVPDNQIASNLGSESSSNCTSVIVIAVFAAMALVCAILSQGFVAADACTHYLYAKYAFVDPVNLVDVWARPLCTLVFAIGAQIGGRIGVRIFCITIAIGCGLVA